MADQRLVDKIMALLAKAVSTDYEPAAATYLAKAQELMIKHALDEADLTGEARERVVVDIVPLPKDRPSQSLWGTVADPVNVRAIRWTFQRELRLIGYEADVIYVKAMYASLLLQREAALSRVVKPVGEHGGAFNTSFRSGFTRRIQRGGRSRQVQRRTQYRDGSARHHRLSPTADRSVGLGLRRMTPAPVSTRPSRSWGAMSTGTGSAGSSSRPRPVMRVMNSENGARGGLASHMPSPARVRASRSNSDSARV
jgi:hypothetical protein